MSIRRCAAVAGGTGGPRGAADRAAVIPADEARARESASEPPPVSDDTGRGATTPVRERSGAHGAVRVRLGEAVERYAEAAWKLRCERAAEAKERPSGIGPWQERASSSRRSTGPPPPSSPPGRARRWPGSRGDAEATPRLQHAMPALCAVLLPWLSAGRSTRRRRGLPGCAARPGRGDARTRRREGAAPWPYDGPGPRRVTGNLLSRRNHHDHPSRRSRSPDWEEDPTRTPTTTTASRTTTRRRRPLTASWS